MLKGNGQLRSKKEPVNKKKLLEKKKVINQSDKS